MNGIEQRTFYEFINVDNKTIGDKQFRITKNQVLKIPSGSCFRSFVFLSFMLCGSFFRMGTASHPLPGIRTSPRFAKKPCP
jgi:hypothetical protein